MTGSVRSVFRRDACPFGARYRAGRLLMRLYVYLNCRESHELLSRRRDAPVSRVGRMRLALHLATCRTCRRVGHQFDVLGRAVRRLGT